MKVLVCDDEKQRSDEAIDAIKRSGASGIEITSLVEGELRDELTKLFELIDRWLKNPDQYSGGENLAFDSVDVAVLDNNLAHLDIKGTRLTAEAVIGYIRAFTDVPYMVSLNKNSDVDFDLRFLVGDYETRADIALNTDHLRNRALWTGKHADAQNGFQPWYWPTLSGIAQRRRDQIQFVRKHIHDSVFSTLGIPTDDEALGFLSLHAKGALSPASQVAGAASSDNGIPIEKLTFQDVFLAKSRSMPLLEEREAIVEGVRQGNTKLENVIARVVAADIDLWFRRDLVGPQEMLVDVPHLLMRMPFLLGDQAGKLNAWNAALSDNRTSHGLDANLYKAHLERASFPESLWLPNPAFHWPALKSDEDLNRRFFTSKQSDWADAVFCEDTSSFRPRGGTDGEGVPAEFTAEFEGSWAQRFVAKLTGLNYTPLTRLST